jgi:hypothetical protein
VIRELMIERVLPAPPPNRTINSICVVSMCAPQPQPRPPLFLMENTEAFKPCSTRQPSKQLHDRDCRGQHDEAILDPPPLAGILGE